MLVESAIPIILVVLENSILIADDLEMHIERVYDAIWGAKYTF